MINKTVLSRLNWQLATETSSAVLYRNMSYYFRKVGLNNLADYYMSQSNGEMSHADGIANYIAGRGNTALITNDNLTIRGENVLDILEQTYEHEQQITKYLYEIYELACDNEDILTKVFIHDYLKEQIEEEEISLTLLDNLKRTNDMLIFDERVKHLTNKN